MTDHVPAWLPMSVPVRRSSLPPHMTHAWVTELFRRRWDLTLNYWEADRLVVLQLVGLPLRDDAVWNLWAEAP